MRQNGFEQILETACAKLTAEAREKIFPSSERFEKRVREVLRDLTENYPEVEIDFNPHPQAFPDIAVGNFGVEVKFTLADTWRSVANSVLETNRIESVEKVYLIFGKMGGMPEVKWDDYEKSVIHVRTSHVPRFEVEIAVERSLFEFMGITYDAFRILSMEEKTRYIREYARSRLKKASVYGGLKTRKMPIILCLFRRGYIQSCYAPFVLLHYFFFLFFTLFKFSFTLN
jgi:hypothetical protein